MKYVYALALIEDLTTEEEILSLYDEEYLEEVLRIKDEFMASY